MLFVIDSLPMLKNIVPTTWQKSVLLILLGCKVKDCFGERKEAAGW
jgi:hypothetical protein